MCRGNRFLLASLAWLWYDFYMNRSRIIYSILAILFGTLAIAFGIFLVVYGEVDDSPGGQVLGLIVVIIGIVGIIKLWIKIICLALRDLAKPDKK